MWSWKWATITLGPPLLFLASIASYEIANALMYSPRPFDPAGWQTGSPRQRMRMAGDLHRVLIGKTWAEAVELLGPPDLSAGGRWLVIKGNVISIFEWHEWVELRFDRETGRVSEVTFFD